MRKLSACLILLASIPGTFTPGAACASTWESGFYRPSEVDRPVASKVKSDYLPYSVCFQQITAAQTKYKIPDNLLVAIGIQEAGRQLNGKLVIWPWTANTNGKGFFFGSKEALDNYVKKTRASGVYSTDVGCMQINQRWHADQFASLEAATDPASNVDYAARFLRDLYAQTGDWWEAAGRYHSTNAIHKSAYQKKLTQNLRVAQMNVGQFKSDLATDAALVQAIDAPRVQPDFNWSADMTDANSGRSKGAMSIYSAHVIQPILHSYTEMN